MKRYIFIWIALFGMSFPGKAQETLQGIGVGEVRMAQSDGNLTVDMNLDLSDLQVNSNRAVLLTPRLVNGDRRKDLASVGIYGRQRYYHYVRNGKSLIGSPDEMTYRASRKPDSLPYHAAIPYEDWMDGARLELLREDYGCCQSLTDEQTCALGDYRRPQYTPSFVYVQPQAEVVKSRSLQGAAFIEFAVNKADIRPDYRANRTELDKIQATIDSVRNDADMQVTSLSIKGFASPEGSYANNARLARERTEALKKYVSQLYAFSDSFISTSSEAEDWAGVRTYVEQSSLPHKADILALIDSDRDPDNKEWKIKTDYPDDYRTLKEQCYPALRHSDYRVEYVIRSFKEPEEIRRVLHSHPEKLSMQEFYLAAQGLEPGSSEFNEVFDTAVRMYPADATANLNAANAAMTRGSLDEATRYLDKAGTSAEAMYARGVHAALSKNYDEAERLFTQARSAGVAQTGEALRQVQEMKKYK